MEVFKAKMDALVPEDKNVVISVIENFICDAVKGGSDDIAMNGLCDKAIKDYLNVIYETGTIDFNNVNINKFRYQCKNVKLRHLYFRLISKDFFTMEKMFKYKMVDSDKCKRCGEVETYKRLIWECGEAKRIWQHFNAFVTSANQKEERVLDYENVFRI